MRMKTIAGVAAAFLTLALAWVPQASAVPLSPMTGGFSVAGPFDWVTNSGAKPGPGNLSLATGIDFEQSGGTLDPFVDGKIVVVTSSGSFTSLTPGTFGTAKDLGYKGTSSLFGYPPVASFELAGGFTVDLLSFTTIQTSCLSGCDTVSTNPSLLLQGKTMIKNALFADTPGTFSFSGGNAGGTNFSFSAQNETVPEPTSMILLGLGLTGLVLGRRLKK